MQPDRCPARPRGTRRGGVAAALGLLVVVPVLAPSGSPGDGRDADTLVVGDSRPPAAPPPARPAATLRTAPAPGLPAGPGAPAGSGSAGPLGTPVTPPAPPPPTAAPGGIPAVALAAYQAAEARLASAEPGCRLDWPLLAAIGRVESDHGRYAGRVLDPDGRSRPPIRGIRLDGTRDTSVIPDTEDGHEDGDDAFDRAIGPMQFLPTTWSLVAVDADGDGQRSADDLDDAALGAGIHLCARGEVRSYEGRTAAVFRYNRSAHYVRTVLALADRYAGGPVTVVPGAPDPAPGAPARPAPADPGTPPAAPLPDVPRDVGPASPTVLPPTAAVPGTTAEDGVGGSTGRPGDTGPVAASPPVTPTPSVAPSPSEATAPSGAPGTSCVSPAGSPSPSPSPSGSGSGSGSASPSPSPSPVGSPSPSPSPSPSGTPSPDSASSSEPPSPAPTPGASSSPAPAC